jgi:hypothetical protein
VYAAECDIESKFFQIELFGVLGRVLQSAVPAHPNRGDQLSQSPQNDLVLGRLADSNVTSISFGGRYRRRYGGKAMEELCGLLGIIQNLECRTSLISVTSTAGITRE